MNQHPTNHRKSTALQCLDGFSAMGNPEVRAGEELENGVGRPKPSHCSPCERRWVRRRIINIQLTLVQRSLVRRSIQWSKIVYCLNASRAGSM